MDSEINLVWRRKDEIIERNVDSSNMYAFLSSSFEGYTNADITVPNLEVSQLEDLYFVLKEVMNPKIYINIRICMG